VSEYARADDLEPMQDYGAEETSTGLRHVVLTSAASIKPRPVFWLWKNRLALGTLGLLAGREGVGKSTLGYWIAARITEGDLFGCFAGTPKAVLVCATEDSWEHTIVPRLMAAGADLTRVYRVDVVTALNITVGMSLPRDLEGVERAANEVDAALMLLDPLVSRLGDLDTHKDAEVRQALEPLVAIADRVNMAILGIIHHNKSGSSDPLQVIMASKAFTAVARSVHTVVPDPDDDTDTRKLFGTPKNNLGRGDLPTLTFTIASHPIDTDEGTAWTGRLEWGEEMAASISDAMRRASDSNEDRSATSEATDWLSDYVAINGGQVLSADAKKDGAKAGHSVDSIKRARTRARLKVTSSGFPRVTFWELVDPTVGAQSEQAPRGDSPTALTTPTGAQSVQSVQSEQLWETQGDPATTERQPCAICPTGTALPGRGICSKCDAA
jgi:AAA domain